MVIDILIYAFLYIYIMHSVYNPRRKIFCAFSILKITNHQIKELGEGKCFTSQGP